MNPEEFAAALRDKNVILDDKQIGRASCRERV